MPVLGVSSTASFRERWFFVLGSGALFFPGVWGECAEMSAAYRVTMTVTTPTAPGSDAWVGVKSGTVFDATPVDETRVIIFTTPSLIAVLFVIALGALGVRRVVWVLPCIAT